MRHPRLDTTTNADNLLALRERLESRSYESPMLDLRLDFNEESQVLTQYLTATMRCKHCGKLEEEHD
jgi:hypothetical protein